MRLKVEGMFCAHCSKSVSDTFDKVGIRADVNLAKNEVIFNYDDEKVSLQYLQRLVKKAGYTLVVEEKKKIDFSKCSLYLAIAVLIFSLVSMIGHMIGHHNSFFMALNNQYVQLVVASISLICLGIPFIIRAYKELKFKRFGMDFLISFASVIAYALSIYTVIKGQENYFHAVSMILSVISVGHFINNKLKALNGQKTTDVTNYAATTALLKVGDDFVETDVDEVEEGDLVKVVAGALIPVDGIVESGNSNVDEKIINGESRSREVSSGDVVYASSTNLGNPIVVKASKSSLDSLFSNIINESYALDNSRGNLNKISDFIASIFVPLVILISIIAFLINFFVLQKGNVEQSIVDAVAVLVVSCPCAFGLAVPLASLNGYYLALKNGILFRSGDTFERVKKINKIFFDKTGTLTKGELTIVDMFGDKEYLPLVKGLEENSSHPLAKSIIKELCDIDSVKNLEVEEIKGKGLAYKEYKLGSKDFVKDYSISNELQEFISKNESTTVIYLAKNEEIVLAISLEDTIKDDAKIALSKLRESGVETYMLTGDSKGYALSIGQQLGIEPNNIFSEVNPSEKGEIISSNRNKGDVICYVGDGINDLLALQKSDLSIASYQAADVASEKAEVKLLKDSLTLIPKTIKLSRHVYFNIIENFGWAFLYNACMIPLAVLGILSPTLSSVLMIVSNITLILNSLRIRLWKGDKK